MPGLIPGFISSRYRKGILSGAFQGSVLVIDVSGFTPMAEVLSERGNEGADTLSKVINTLFSGRLLRVIRGSGGFVSDFSGDSFTVILPGKTPEAGEQLALKIFSMIGCSFERSGRIVPGELSIRAGGSFGEIEWGIAGGASKTWFFTGPVVVDVHRTMDSTQPGEILFSRLTGQPEESDNSKDFPSARSSRKTESDFFPDTLLEGDRSGEFRRVFPVFIGLDPGFRGSISELQRISSKIMSMADTAGGYFNGVHQDVTGSYFLVLFGAPWSFENDGHRALFFARSVLSECTGINRIGISSGTAFAGNIGFRGRSTYTVLGSHVNRAARIMRFSDEYGIFVTEDVVNRMPRSAEKSVSISSVSLKGISESTGVVRIDPERPPGLRKRFDSRLIGRERELGFILDRAGPLLSGEKAGSVIVSGRAGVGKSHLIHEACSRLEKLGCRVVRLQCSDISGRSFEPLTALMRMLFGQADTAGEPENRAVFRIRWTDQLEALASSGKAGPGFLEELERTKPFVEALLGIPEDGSIYHKLEAKGRHENMLLAIRNLLESMAYQSPLVLVVEDIQWIDSATEEALELLSRSAGSVPILILCSCRPSDDGVLPDIALNSTGDVSLSLDNLDKDSIAKLAGAILGAPSSDKFLKFLRARTLNNPFYVEQYLKYLLETGSLEESKNGWELKAEPDTIPERISDLLIARLDRLSADLKRLVQTASVLGYEFNIDVLSEMYRGETIEPLLLSGAQFEIWKSLEQLLYIFHHALLRDAAYGMQLKSDLARLHELAALTIETLYGERREFYPDLAYHYEQAGNVVSACRYLWKAAEISERDYHLEECLGYLLRLLDFKARSDTVERLNVMLKTVTILTALGRWNKAIELAGDAMSVAEKSGDTQMLADATSSRAWLMIRKGQYEDAKSFMESAEALYESIGSTKGIARVKGYRGVLAFNTCNYAEAGEIFLETLNTWQGLGNKKEELKTLTNLGCVYKDIGEVKKSESFFNRAIELSQMEGEQFVLSTALGNRGTLYRNAGRFDESIRDFHRAISIAEGIGYRRGISAQLGGLALVKYDLGEFDEAIELYTRQLNISNELGYKFGIAEAHGYLAICYDDTDSLSEAALHYDECIRISRSIDLAYYTGIFLGMKALMLFNQGKYMESQEANEESIEICSRLGVSEILVNGFLLRQRLRIATSKEKTEILSALDAMRSQLDKEDDTCSKATAAYQLWKTLRGTDTDIQENYDLNLVREEALAFTRAAMDERPCYSNRKMIEELEAGTV